MTTAPPTAARLSDGQLAELLELLKEADSVELKATVPAADRTAAGRALGIDPLQAEIRQVYFFDTPDLALDAAGVVVRARRIQRRGGDSVVKLRPVVPADVGDDLRRSAAFGLEVDAMPGGFVCSGSLKRKLAKIDPRSVALGEAPVRKLFSQEQRLFYAAHAPAGVALDDLSVLGPIFVLKLKFVPEGLGRRLAGELWLYPDNAMVVELSTRCPPAETFQAAAELRAFLGARGVDLSAEQETKTRRALAHFAGSLAASPPGDGAPGS